MALKQRGQGQYVMAGDMDHQLEIETLSYTDDGKGGRVSDGSPTTVKAWGNLMPINAARAQSFGITMTSKPHEIDMRYAAGYIPEEGDKITVVETSQVLYVHSVVNTDMRYERVKVMATEKK